MMSFLLAISFIFITTLKAQGPQQLVPPIPPPPPPQTPQTQQTNPGPVSVAPTNPNPTTPVNPNPPVTPVNPINPVTPQQPPATPQYGPPQQYNPYNPYQQQPGFGGGFIPGLVDPQNLNCEFGQCRYRKITLSPGQGFQLNCQQARQCDGLDLTLNVGFDPTNIGSGVSEINDLNFDAPQTGVTVRINGIAGNNIEVNNIHCKTFGACENLKIIAGYGVEVWNMNVHCELPHSCRGCTINGQSCQMYSMMNGNNNGYMPYGGYGGYTNTPNVPQQPQGQYPGAQQPQQYNGAPQYPPQYPQWI